MPKSHRLSFRSGRAAMGLLAAFAATSSSWAQTASEPGHPESPTPLVLAVIALVIAVAALIIAWLARTVSVHAAEEAGTARTRANQIQQGRGVAPEALAAVERVWATRFASLESQLQGVGRPPSSRTAPAERPVDVTGRVDELEKVVAGLSVTLTQLRRLPPAPPAPPAAPPAAPGIAWPATLSAETSAMNDVRQTLSQALKSADTSARDLLERLRKAEKWAATKPPSGEVATELQEISTLLLAALRRGAAVAPLDGVLYSDRVLAALRTAWKPFLPQLDCRSFYPGTTFDPDWMEDHTRAGLRRPVISEMLSWAVFEKLDTGRRVLAKAHVTAD